MSWRDHFGMRGAPRPASQPVSNAARDHEEKSTRHRGSRHAGTGAVGWATGHSDYCAFVQTNVVLGVVVLPSRASTMAFNIAQETGIIAWACVHGTRARRAGLRPQHERS